MTETRLTWKEEDGWTIITSPDKLNFLVASPDRAKAFADIPVVWDWLHEFDERERSK